MPIGRRGAFRPPFKMIVTEKRRSIKARRRHISPIPGYAKDVMIGGANNIFDAVD